jgi:hypothetical protein
LIVLDFHFKTITSEPGDHFEVSDPNANGQFQTPTSLDLIDFNFHFKTITGEPGDHIEVTDLNRTGQF